MHKISPNSNQIPFNYGTKYRIYINAFCWAGRSIVESAKGQDFWEDRHISYWYSGQSDRDPGISFVTPEAYFDFQRINGLMTEFGGRSRERFTTERIRDLADYLKGTLYRFVEKFGIDIVVPQNCLAIPMHVPWYRPD